MRARTATFISALALATATAGTGTALADTQCANTGAVPGSVPASVISDATLCLLNEQRAAAGEVALVAQPELTQAATSYSQEMVAQQFFSHIDPAGTDPTARIAKTAYTGPYAVWIVGENLAWGSGQQATPAAIVTSWMNSAGHRANILNGDYRDIGLGIATGTPTPAPAAGATYTTEFGVRSQPLDPTASGAQAGAAGSETSSRSTSGSGAGKSTRGSKSKAGKHHKARKHHKSRKHATKR